MAAWQFDVELLPAAGVERRYGAVPISVSSVDSDEYRWWQTEKLDAELDAEFARIAPPTSSWNENLMRWGVEDGDRIDVLKDKGLIREILVRFDVRNISQTFVIGVVNLMRRHKWLLRVSDGRIFAPSPTKLLAVIRTSPAFQFVQDPKRFLELCERTDAEHEPEL